MDWKRFYRDELTSGEGRATADRAFAGVPPVDAALDAALAQGGVVSFPHTMLRASAPALARVVEAIYRRGAERVVALGVLHGGVLEPHERERLAQHGGVYVRGSDMETPLGALRPFDAMPPASLFRRDDDLLRNEFSLDTFLALLAHRGATLRRTPPRVLPLYVGPAADPDGSRDRAAALAGWLRAQGKSTVLVATGDIVHYGHGYSAPADMAGKPSDPEGLLALFRAEVERSFSLLFEKQDAAAFLRHAADTLRSDQVNVLPVVAGVVGPGGEACIVDFEWADYADVLGQPPPCLVGSALVAFVPGR